MILTLLIVFLATLLLQLFFLWRGDRFLSSRILEGNSPITEFPGISVVVAARNEGENLKSLIDRLLIQDYPHYEIILVNDRSTDNTRDVLDQYTSHSAVRVLHIDEKPESWNGKKFALDQGIRKSSHDWILLTDGDCMPSTSSWITSMYSSRREDSSIVVGLSPMVRRYSLLGAFTQYENFLTAWQMMVFTLWGRGYMGLGRNLLYSKTLFLEGNGFDAIKDLNGGDDDLLVNAWSKHHKVSVCMEKDARVYTYGEKTWSSFIHQKTRHLLAGKKYRWATLLLPGLFILSGILFWLSGISLILLGYEPYIIILGFISRYMFMIPSFWDSKEQFGVKFKIHSMFILDFMFTLYYISMFFISQFVRRVKWE